MPSVSSNCNSSSSSGSDGSSSGGSSSSGGGGGGGGSHCCGSGGGSGNSCSPPPHPTPASCFRQLGSFGADCIQDFPLAVLILERSDSETG